MAPDDVWQFIILIILLLLSSFFSASETALMSLSKIKVRHMVDENVPGANTVNKLIENPSKLLGAILVGNNVVNIGASALATSLSIKHFGNRGVGIATGIVTLFVLIFGEITPKSLAAQNSDTVSLKVSKPISAITFILSPLVTVLTYLTNGLIKLLGGETKTTQPFITEDELKTIVNVSHEEGVLEGDEKKMIYNVFEFGDSQAKDVMTPRIDMIAADVNLTYSEIIALLKEEHFSRIPVYEDVNDNIIGILYIKDLIFFNGNDEDFDIKKFIRPAYFTYEFKPISELFTEMSTRRISMSIVLDEYGGTAGIVTMEDLVEEIVGDIDDEFDEEDEEIEVIKEDEFVVDGSTKIDDINELIGTNLESEDFDSIGGFVIGLLGRLPKLGESVEYNNIKFKVEDMDKNRIGKLRILT
ncbi:HlyC/CorC family transporter [Haloimpatiens sp. FM7315]|uniref:HlyC/CorC family transporter n=1 Tax=Haloimpatiens sp. FM7315 TaxID=3298609 RepID=UPI00370C761C